MKLREKLIKATADALYASFWCPERDMIEGCSACQSKAMEYASVAVDAALSAVTEERSATVRYLREEADKSGTTPMAEVLGDAADTIERGLHHES